MFCVECPNTDCRRRFMVFDDAALTARACPYCRRKVPVPATAHSTWPDDLDPLISLLCPHCGAYLWAHTRCIGGEELQCQACRNWLKLIPDSEDANNTILSCPNADCGQQLRVPTDRGELRLTCPKCRNSWDWACPAPSGEQAAAAGPFTKAKLGQLAKHGVAALLGTALSVLCMWLLVDRKSVV